MKKQPCALAVDLGASSGRVIAGWIQENRLQLKELHRFDNGYEEKNGHICWDFDRLFQEIVAGMKAAGEAGFAPESIGVDTWGVDFVLVNRSGAVLGDTVAYRDGRTTPAMARVYEKLSREELYRRTGIGEQVYNTVFQLQAVKDETPRLLEQAERILFSPEYLTYRLSGAMVNEYSIASTSGLLRAGDRNFDPEILEAIGVPKRLFQKPVLPGTVVGELLPEIAEQVGYCCKVILPGAHDTASAVLAVPAESGSFAFLSSGTWSLLGTERSAPLCTPEADAAGFTNEGGWGGSIRFLKNIMGLWMIQSVRRELKEQGEKFSYSQLEEMARQSRAFPAWVDVNDICFLAPKFMIQAVRDWCGRHGQPVPETTGQLLMTIYRGLAMCYADSIRYLQKLTGDTFTALHLVGGGCLDDFLNRLTCELCGLPVLAGPVEATAIGNLCGQLLAEGVLSSREEARALVRRSFPIRRYSPQQRESSV